MVGAALERHDPVRPITNAVHDVESIVRSVTHHGHGTTHAPASKIHDRQIELRLSTDKCH